VVQVMGGAAHASRKSHVRRTTSSPAAYTRRGGRAQLGQERKGCKAIFRSEERRGGAPATPRGGEQQRTALGAAPRPGRPGMIPVGPRRHGPRAADRRGGRSSRFVKSLSKGEVSVLLAEQNTNVALRYATMATSLENGRVPGMDGGAARRARRERGTSRSSISGISSGARRRYSRM